MNFIIWQAFLFSAFAALICDASKFNNSRYLVSCSDNQFDQGSSYGTDLKNLLSFLSSNATKFDGYYTINTTTIYGSSRAETIYGLFKYRGDITPQDCASCVNNDVQHLPPKECPSDKGVMMWYKECYIRYSNVSFLGNFEEGVHISWRNNENITTLDYDVEGFMRLVGDTLQNLVHQLMSWLNQPTWYSLKEGSKKYFQVNTTMVNNFVRLYTMVQCTRSLAPTDCEECLAIVINEMPVCCNGSRGGQAMSSGCYARFEVYPFYNAFPSSFISQFPLAKGNGKRKKKFLLLTSLLTIFPISATIWLLVLFGNRNFRRMMSKKTCDEIDEIKSTLDSLQYDYTTIKTATCNFSLDNKIRKGGFGDVYKGKLKDGQEIAVKRLSNDTGQGIEQFKTEVVLVAKLQHRNLVKLLGFCVSSKEKMLVFEFLLNSSLDRFLYGSIKKAILDWQTRVKIIVDIARGLLYLHEDSRLKVVHRDLKTSNILLDEFMNPKISDFGLPKHFGVNQS